MGLGNTWRKLIKEGISSVEQDSTIINRCVKYFAAIISWMFLAALSAQSAAEDFVFHMLDRFVVSAAEGSNTSSGKPEKGNIRAWAR